MTASVNLHLDAAPARASVLRTDTHGHFIAVDIGGVALFLAGYDAAAVASARALASALTACADDLERLLPAPQGETADVVLTVEVVQS